MLTLPDSLRNGACRDTDAALFFGDGGVGGATVLAKRICATCPVIDVCRAYAMAEPRLTGVWGGTTHEERKTVRRAARPATTGPGRYEHTCAGCGTQFRSDAVAHRYCGAECVRAAEAASKRRTRAACPDCGRRGHGPCTDTVLCDDHRMKRALDE
jgi:WhiB family redox-sensing transcriptional regulator